MNLSVRYFGLLITTLFSISLHAQIADTNSISIKKKQNVLLNEHYQIKNSSIPAKSFIIPAAMIAYGFTSLSSDGLKDWDEQLKEEVWTETAHRKNHLDNILQFTPAIAVYGLNLAGIKGKNNFHDRTMIYVMSNMVLNTMVYSIKTITKEKRPDGSAYNSFPSGHTAEAFASAEFLRQEYKDVSPWYGIGGYAIATATGMLRMYNNKHWLSDVIAGAGVGIASTKLAYWIYPAIKRKFYRNKNMNTMVMPYYQNRGGGISMVYNFH